jgi:hypothetical protein
MVHFGNVKGEHLFQMIHRCAELAELVQTGAHRPMADQAACGVVALLGHSQ